MSLSDFSIAILITLKELYPYNLGITLDSWCTNTGAVSLGITITFRLLSTEYHHVEYQLIPYVRILSMERVI